MDNFVAIAQQKIQTNDAEITRPEPIPFDKKVCVLEKTDAQPIATKAKMETKEELYAALSDIRQKYACYLENHAPKLSAINTKIPLTEFVLDGKETITLPHYGGPLGNATKCYETKFVLDDFTDKAVYICVGGADYIANVYINDVCVGTHEGFFSPFEFEITKLAKQGQNKLKIILENDFIYRGNTLLGEAGDGERFEGDKLYAATGIGYDDPVAGWHHCPPGMGLYNYVRVEVRNKINITDLYVRPILEECQAELWIELDSTVYEKIPVAFDISLYGQNFKETVFEHMLYVPMFDDTEMPAQHGKNLYKVSLAIPGPKIWDLETPYLYQAQILVQIGEMVSDCGTVSFGMRSFSQDTETVPKGMFYLNGRKIKLRGANTMGFEQLDVLRGDFDQLVDDILLAKICNMNYWRLTQRPVQDEVYQYCDMLGLMTQTDLPLFGVMRRNKVCEGIRQTEEMVRMVRKHPCNILISYLNEPSNHKRPHRHLMRPELEDFFRACDLVVKLNHPDCVIKHIEGDFAPPDHCEENSMPDNHTYMLWYNGQTVPIGDFYKGYWAKIKPDWYYGCGEYGAEGMDFPEVMRKYYPKEWLKEPFDPGNIVCAQGKVQHTAFFDTPDSLEEWVTVTQAHQAFAASFMTEAFRRDPRMVSFAIHLFIDAWPSGWMKTIMDCERTPKPAYFAYRNALEPILVSLRSDRFTYYEGETVSIEAYVCNDTAALGDENYQMVFELYDGEAIVMRQVQAATFQENTSTYIANAEFVAEHVQDRKKMTLKAILLHNGEVCNYNTFDVEIFEKRAVKENDNIVLIRDLEIGEHEIAGETVKVESTYKVRDFRIFVSRKTGHPAVAEFYEKDFSMWYDAEKDKITPLAEKKFFAEGFAPILICDGSDSGAMVAGVKEHNGKKYVICLLDLRTENPVAERFLGNLYKL